MDKRENEEAIAVIHVEPSTNLIAVLSSSGYTVPSALADILDNSIYSKATEISVDFVFDGRESVVTISDNGVGMSRDELISALTYASHSMSEEREASDLGRFGVGMKAASFSFCKTLRVESKTDGGAIHAFESHKDAKTWDIYEMPANADSIRYRHGTKITWKHLALPGFAKIGGEAPSLDERESFFEAVDKAADHLSMVFGRIIRDEGLRIYVNGNRLKGWDPFWVPGKSLIETVVEERAFDLDGQKLHVVGYLMPTLCSLNSEQKDYLERHDESLLTDLEGFYVYRNNRLISGGGWLGIDGLSVGEKYNYARIGLYYEQSAQTDEYLKLNYTKTNIQPPPELCEYLKRIAKLPRQKSRLIHNPVTQRPYKRVKKSEPVWNVTRKKNEQVFSINPGHPLIKRYTSHLNERERNAFFALLEEQFPYQDLINGTPTVRAYSEEELSQLVCDAYQKALDEGKSESDACAAVLKIYPFSDEKYRLSVIDILSSLKA